MNPGDNQITISFTLPPGATGAMVYRTVTGMRVARGEPRRAMRFKSKRAGTVAPRRRERWVPIERYMRMNPLPNHEDTPPHRRRAPAVRHYSEPGTADA